MRGFWSVKTALTWENGSTHERVVEALRIVRARKADSDERTARRRCSRTTASRTIVSDSLRYRRCAMKPQVEFRSIIATCYDHVCGQGSIVVRGINHEL